MEGAVLVIEDHPMIATALCRLARACGLASTIAQNAEQATPLLLRARTGVIADVGLPDGDGLELLATARRTQTWPALVLTGNDSRDAANRAFDLDASYIVKPVEPERISNWLSRVRSRFDERLSRLLGAWQARYALTVAELNVLELAARGKANDEIAAALHVSPETIKSHVKSLLRKTNDNSIVRAALRLLRGD